jgi:hypothetical protein
VVGEKKNWLIGKNDPLHRFHDRDKSLLNDGEKIALISW